MNIAKHTFLIIILILFSSIHAEIKVGDKAPTFFANTLDNQYFFLSDTLMVGPMGFKNSN